MGYFAVQVFTRSGKGALREETPVVCKTREQAVRTARRLSLKSAGAIAFHRSANEFDEYAAPEFLAVHGDVPEHLADDIPPELSAVMAAENAMADRPVDDVGLKLKGWTELL